MEQKSHCQLMKRVKLQSNDVMLVFYTVLSQPQKRRSFHSASLMSHTFLYLPGSHKDNEAGIFKALNRATVPNNSPSLL